MSPELVGWLERVRRERLEAIAADSFVRVESLVRIRAANPWRPGCSDWRDSLCALLATSRQGYRALSQSYSTHFQETQVDDDPPPVARKGSRVAAFLMVIIASTILISGRTLGDATAPSAVLDNSDAPTFVPPTVDTLQKPRKESSGQDGYPVPAVIVLIPRREISVYEQASEGTVVMAGWYVTSRLAQNALSVALTLLATLIGLLSFRRVQRREKESGGCTREELIARSTTVADPYVVDTSAPVPGAFVDAAGEEIKRHVASVHGREIDIGRTVVGAASSAGHFKYERKERRVGGCLVVLVDIESGSHPFLFAVEWVLARWQKQGVQFARYDFNSRPMLLHPRNSPQERRRRANSVPLGQALRRSRPYAIIVFSRLHLSVDLNLKLAWPALLPACPKVLVDLNPRPVQSRDHESRANIDALERAGVRRVQFSEQGLVAVANIVAGFQPRRDDRNAGLGFGNSAQVTEAVKLWAACAACVPDPTWRHLDSIRRNIGEIQSVLPRASSVQLLLEWIERNSDSRGLNGRGGKLSIEPSLRFQLTAWLRSRPGDVEHQVRRLLVRQMKASDMAGDAFGALKRDLKIAIHESILGDRDPSEVLAGFARSGVAPEMERLVANEREVLTTLGKPTEPWEVLPNVVVKAEPRGVWWGQTARWVALPLFFLLASHAAKFYSINSRLPWRHETIWSIPETRKIVVEPEDAAVHLQSPMKFVRLGAGTFWMGSPPGEFGHFAEENLHQAEIAALWVSESEVAQGQWTQLMGDREFDCTSGCGATLPAHTLSWVDAVRFANALTAFDNKQRQAAGRVELTQCYREDGGSEWIWEKHCSGFRLLTEAEWEYSARAGTDSPYSFDGEPTRLCEFSNASDLSAHRIYPTWPFVECDDGFPGLAPVKSRKPNAWGLYDVHGNVSEWVWDRYGDRYPAAKTPSDYSGPAAGAGRVIRGGSFMNGPTRLRSANRSRIGPLQAAKQVGLRCARRAD